MEYIISRSFRLPTNKREFANTFHYNLWSKKYAPYDQFQTGDILYWYETPSRSVVWKTRTVKADRFQYRSKDQLRDRLASNMGDFDEDEPYFANGPEQGYCLAYKSEPLQRLNLPKPENMRFPQLGWLRAEDKLAKIWLSQRGATVKRDGRTSLTPKHVHSEDKSVTYSGVVCRLCWNSEGWTHPTGEAQQLEHGTFVSVNGFGHEEWLMNVGWLIDGYHYGFLQPFNSAFDKWNGRTTDVLLYAISPAKVRYYVGRIKDLEVLTAAEAATAVRQYQRLGWYKEMREQVKALGGKTRTIDHPAAPYQLLNVRFDPRKLEVFDVPADPYLERLPPRYRVYQPKGKVMAARSENRAKRRGTQDIGNKSLLPQARKGSGTVIANPIEKMMQKEVCDHLRKRYSSVEVERDFVDIKVQRPEGTTLIELKSSPSALRAIRAGLGQVLAYVFVHPEWRSTLFELVIVGQGLPTDQSTEYINWLRERYKLPVRYIPYQHGSAVFDL